MLIRLGRFLKNRMRHRDDRFRKNIAFVLAMSNYLDQEHASSAIGTAAKFRTGKVQKKDLQTKKREKRPTERSGKGTGKGDPVLHDLDSEVQNHRYTFTCKSSKGGCRFHFSQNGWSLTKTADGSIRNKPKIFYHLQRKKAEININPYNRLVLRV